MGKRQRGSGPIDWIDRPGQTELAFVPIYSAIPRARLLLVCLSDKVVGVNTHFIDGSTIPCVGKDAHCEGCQAKKAKRWKGYIGAWEPLNERVVLAEITLDAYRTGPAQLRGDGPGLRGYSIVLSRQGKKPNAPVRVEIAALPVDPGSLPKAPDVKAVLRNIWGFVDIQDTP